MTSASKGALTGFSAAGLCLPSAGRLLLDLQRQAQGLLVLFHDSPDLGGREGRARPKVDRDRKRSAVLEELWEARERRAHGDAGPAMRALKREVHRELAAFAGALE